MSKDFEKPSQKEVGEPIKENKQWDESQDDEEYDYVTIPPDGGFGWVVLVACFVNIK